VGVGDEPTIELDLTAATAVPTAVPRAAPTADRARSRSCAGSAINADLHRAAGGGRGSARNAALGGTVDAAVDLAAGHDDDEIERANITAALPAADDASDRWGALAIAAAITAALAPHGPNECATATAVGVGDDVGDGDVAVAEDMTLDVDEEDAGALTREEGSRHDAANSPGASPAGQALRRGPRPVGGSNRGGSPARPAAARRAPRAGRGPAPRSTGRRP
jgi:hypothetical protein